MPGRQAPDVGASRQGVCVLGCKPQALTLPAGYSSASLSRLGRAAEGRASSRLGFIPAVRFRRRALSPPMGPRLACFAGRVWPAGCARAALRCVPLAIGWLWPPSGGYRPSGSRAPPNPPAQTSGCLQAIANRSRLGLQRSACLRALCGGQALVRSLHEAAGRRTQDSEHARAAPSFSRKKLSNS